MKVYAEVSINGISKTAKKTQVDKRNECNPCWNCSIVYTIGERAVQSTNVDLVIKLFSERTFGDRYSGEVKLALSLFENGLSAQNVSHAVIGTSCGILNISYNLGEKIVVQKPSGWHKAVRIMTKAGVNVLINGTLTLMTGGAFVGDFDIPIFTDPCDVDIIDLVDDVICDDVVVIDDC
ncbi:C2 domain-containing protein [Abeliophyllum distichum]|uniref:C2 domain-containing protein n=1 Tax=Abeliophyllum distichum TaxID=126358 RepID=A0ABD1S982_9LAMI